MPQLHRFGGLSKLITHQPVVNATRQLPASGFGQISRNASSIAKADRISPHQANRILSRLRQIQCTSRPFHSTRPLVEEHHPANPHKHLPKHRSAVVRFLIKGFFYLGITVAGTSLFVIGFFLYDATTYRETPGCEPVPISSLALNPRRGGPKNLPIVEHFVDDDDSDPKKAAKHKPKLVILGTGWGSVALVKQLLPEQYHVTVISPSNQFCFTPMLPSATVGTLELRSLVEPIRTIISRIHGRFLQGTAKDVALSEKLLEVESIDSNGKAQSFYVPYDKLVIACGSITNPHGVPGLANCHFLKDIHDARQIRNTVIKNLEDACLPVTTDEERRRLLSFVVCGGGPTGVEFAAELYDMLNEDLMRSFPRIIRNEISVHLVQSRGHILNTYDEALSKFAEDRFAHDNVDVYTNARVKEVATDKVVFTQKNPDGSVDTKELPMGFCLWSTGLSQTPFAQELAKKLGNSQTNKHALETDTYCRVLGTPLGDVYAIGDCSTIQNNVSDHIVTFLRTVAWEKGKDPENLNISFSDWRRVAKDVKKRFPQAGDHLRRLDKLFQEYDKDKSGTLDFGELSELLRQIDRKLTSLPATAQRAHQQGEYMAKKFNKLAQVSEGFHLNDVDYGDLDAAAYKAFEYRHLGSLAYVGNSAIFDFQGTSFEGASGWKGFAGSLWAVYLWRSIYFAQSVSFRTRCLLAMDWTKRALFGRDLMSVP